jgi:excinuclease ABC subunit C
MIPEKFKQIINSLPSSPGIYKYFDKDNQIIYIGKAKNLKKRVSSYFNKTNHENRKTTVLVSKIEKLEFTIVETETDALLLENVLIKQFQPRFNILLKDDKTYPFICIKAENFPRVFTVRQRIKDGSEYYGPYANGHLMYTLLDLIKNLYPIRTCNLLLTPTSIQAGKFKTCLEYDIGNCKAPCVGLQSESDYQQQIKLIKGILKGNLSEVKSELKNQMADAVSQLQFEKAELLKRKFLLLENYQSKSTIVTKLFDPVEVYSIVSDDKYAYINFLKVVNGMIVQTQTFEIKRKLDESESSLLALTITEVRNNYDADCKDIIVSMSPEGQIENEANPIPKLGDKKQLLDLSMRNASYYRRQKMIQHEHLNPELKTERILNQMKQDLRLTQLPAHIECFDNSNIQGTNPVSACVVFKDAKPSKKDYRIFHVKTVEGPNDFATMQEVVFRRYKRLLDEHQTLPQLIVIDGGKGQLSSAVFSLKKLGIYGQVAVIGIAKRLEELYYPNDELPLFLDKKSETLKVIQKLRDEAHRFGITHHRNIRSKNAIGTELAEIPGIGEHTSQLLLQTFKSVKKIKAATLSDLTAIIGPSKAEKVIQFFKTDH